MIVILADLGEAETRLAAGEKAYEFQTDDRMLRILGPACGFGQEHLKRLRGEGLYAESIGEARAHALLRNLGLTGVWFVKSA